MSYSLTPILIDLPRVEALMGSKDVALLQAVVKEHRRELLNTDGMGEFFEDFEDEIKAEYKALAAGDFSGVDLNRSYPDPEDADDDEPVRETTTGAALAHLILGGKPDPSAGYKYGYALDALCRHLGTVPDHDSWCAIRYRSLEAIDAVLQKAGVKPGTFSVARRLVERGPPVAMPQPDDFPAIGYLRRDEIRKVVAALDLAAIEAAVSRAKDDPDWLRDALGELRSWLEAAAKADRDLICFYY